MNWIFDLDFYCYIERTLATSRHLKPSQVIYRIIYTLRPVASLKKKSFKGEVFKNFSLFPIPVYNQLFKIEDDRYTVQLLNLEKTYFPKINWADLEYGRLWNYNLQYADFLKQEDLSIEVRKHLILDLYKWLYDGKLSPEPYPASLRIMNVIRFLQEHQYAVQYSQQILDGLYSELHYLSGRIEYHLSGNHLLENGFALMMGGAFLNQRKFFQTGKNILKKEMAEQILDDGAHYERSPMYHSLMLFRVLETVFYLSDDSDLNHSLKEYASRMISWLRNMTFGNGSFAHFNDSTDGVAPGLVEILKLAGNCDVPADLEIPLSDSGYRKFKSKDFELIVDVEGIKPVHQPGHAHADPLSFILHSSNQPVIVDPAISTYEAGERRNWERSSKAHNVATVQDENSADAWRAFRVGRRPEVTLLKDTNHELYARLEYKTRSGKFLKQERIIAVEEHLITINDRVLADEAATGRLYFAPSVSVESNDQNSVQLSSDCSISFEGISDLSIFTYRYNEGFNKQKEASGISYNFIDQCSFKIRIG